MTHSEELIRMYQPSTNPEDFDHEDRLNEDGSVTLRMTPSAWHRYNISPDTYQSFNGDSWVESELHWFNEGSLSDIFGEEYKSLDTDVPLHYDCFEWEYDHAQIVRDMADVLADWIQERLWDLGLQSITNVKVLDTWSPAYYNFTSDGFEIELTCDPGELRGLTEDFDVDQWGSDHYTSYDGFLSYVTGRLRETEWHAEYDGGFRIEALLTEGDRYGERDWIMAVAEEEWEIYSNNVKITPDREAIREEILKAEGFMESGHTLAELEEWADEIEALNHAGMDTLV